MGSRSAHSVSKGSCDKITVNCCVNAAGGVLPLMIIFRKYFPSTAYAKAVGAGKAVGAVKDVEASFESQSSE